MIPKIVGTLSLSAKTIAILSVLYLDLTKKINLPIFVIVLFAISGLGLGNSKIIHQIYNNKDYTPSYDYHFHNAIIGIVSIFVLAKKLTLN
jgi:hypothetical protein